ncbi:MAG: tRNA-dihydrouridine synthase [Planctomycetes bacterium]|nr:tRNA-dihydrouridine synthase [Planctomycetota bacterium]
MKNTAHHPLTRFQWKALARPFSVLAPMENVTDTAFRRLIRYCGAPDVMVSEFTHVDKLCAAEAVDTRNRLVFHPEERPLIAQVWGSVPENTFAAVKRLIALGFDGIDLNMGCPMPRAIEGGACSALINNPALASDLFMAALEAADGCVPVSIKTRLGFDRTVTESWAACLLNLNPAALTIHGRIATDKYGGEANWEEIAKVVTLRNDMGSDTLIIGNGDVQSVAEIQAKHQRHGVDGVMVGRAVLKNPLFFRQDGRTLDRLSPAQRIQLLWHHATLCRESFDEPLSFKVLKKYFKVYVTDFHGAADLRAQLNQTKSLEEATGLLQPYLDKDPKGTSV